MSRSDELVALVDALDDGVRAAEADGGIAALGPDVARRLLGVAARLYAVAAEEGAEGLRGDDLSPTEAVVVATAALRAHELTPFDLALWFPRSTP